MMKFALVFGLTAVGTQALASSYTACSNGSIEKVGDSHYAINIYEDGVEFLPYEGSFVLDLTDVNHDGGTFSVVNKKVEYTAEGESTSAIIDAILTLNPAGTKLNAAVSMNKGEFETYQMTCVRKK